MNIYTNDGSLSKNGVISKLEKANLSNLDGFSCTIKDNIFTAVKYIDNQIKLNLDLTTDFETFVRINLVKTIEFNVKEKATLNSPALKFHRTKKLKQIMTEFQYNGDSYKIIKAINVPNDINNSILDKEYNSIEEMQYSLNTRISETDWYMVTEEMKLNKRLMTEEERLEDRNILRKIRKRFKTYKS